MLDEHLFRRESGRLVAALTRIFGVHELTAESPRSFWRSSIHELCSISWVHGPGIRSG